MRKRNIYEPYIGQSWSTPDSTIFEIKDLMVQEDDAWVEYENTQTKNPKLICLYRWCKFSM